MASNNIGIEIGGRTITMVQMKKGRCLCAVERLPENPGPDEQGAFPDALPELIQEMKKKYGFSGKKCSVVLPENTTFFRSITMQPLTDAQLKLNLPNEFRDFTGDDAVEYFYDYALLHMNYDGENNPVSMDIAAGAARKRVVNAYAGLLKSAGLRIGSAIPREMAMINLLLSASEAGRCPSGEFCIAEIAEDTTYISIVSDGELKAWKNIDTACRQIDEVIARAMGTDMGFAVTCRETDRSGVRRLPECKVVYETIALEILKAVNFYRYENQQSELSKIMFCGAGAKINQLTDEILNYTGFSRLDIAPLLPGKPEEGNPVELCLSASGAVL